MRKKFVTDDFGKRSLERLKSTSSHAIAGRIARLERLELNTLTGDQIWQRLGRIMDGYFTKTVTLSTNTLYRARKLDAGIEVTNASELWYPPSKFVKQGRFNRSYEPVFYATSVAGAALWEVRPSIGDRVMLAVCGTIEPVDHFKLAHIGLGKYDGSPLTFGGVPDLQSDDVFLENLESLGILNKWLRIDRYLADLSLTDEAERPGLYNATCEIGEKLTGIPDTLGLLYPSIATGMAALNVRLDAEAADSSLFVSEVWEFEILKRFAELPGRPHSKPGFALMSPIRRTSSISPDGELNWAHQTSDTMQNDYDTVLKRITTNRIIRSQSAN